MAGSMYYKSPEMLMNFMQSELSTDVWSLGCVFAALLYRKSIFFVGENDMHQLITIAEVSKQLPVYMNEDAFIVDCVECLWQAIPTRWHCCL